MTVQADWEIMAVNIQRDGCDICCKAVEYADTTIFSVSNRTGNGQRFLSQCAVGRKIHVVLEVLDQ